jgi:cation/acetate symporter
VAGVGLLTLSAIAVFMRDAVWDTLVGSSAAQLPSWFRSLEAAGLAAVQTQVPRVPVSGFAFKRDAILFALPIAYGYPAVLVYLALAGAIAAALAAASLSALSLGAVLAEDVFWGLKWDPAPTRTRLITTRISVVVAAFAGAWLTLAMPGDPLDLLLSALALSASALFPVLVLSIWWKRLNVLGTIAGMFAGFSATAIVILGGDAGWFGLHGVLAGGVGIPVAVLVSIGGSLVGPAPSRQALELTRDMRVPGGETIHDREMRLLRLRQRQRLA